MKVQRLVSRYRQASLSPRRPIMRLALIWLACMGAVAGSPVLALNAPDATLHYPAQPTSDANAVSQLIVHGALDVPLIEPLLDDFHRRYPHIELTYRNFTTLAIYRTFMDNAGEAGNHETTADVVMSSAMPWQYRLANDGYAQPLHSESARNWPDWARWRQELFGITFEPIVIVYRRELAERFGAVESHADLLSLLERESEALRDRVVTYDPASSGVGYTYAIEEARLSPRYWELVAALGSVDAELVGTTREMLTGLAEGRYLIGYNLLGSYARGFVRNHPELTIAVPSDYALVMQRLAFISRSADNPRAAKLFLDYLLSEAGQRVISEQTPLGAIHPALNGDGTASALRARLAEALRPIPLSPGLLATLDDLKRKALLSRWMREFQRGAATQDMYPSPRETP
ncbi:MAG TPA: ABC transporter substrate-binding protein [Modicisalibacter sp.]|nr:ABC transporter substrate-binding protein [Modicisalibacter sp.]